MGFEGGISRNTERGAHCTTTTATADDQTYTSRYDVSPSSAEELHSCVVGSYAGAGWTDGWMA